MIMGKELSIEEKAQAYDEALSVAMETYQTQPMYRDWLEKMFPELKESDDERIRKDIIVLIKDWWDRVNKDNISTKEQMLAWLEKQGEQILANSAKTCKVEQKPAWSEEDKRYLNIVSAVIDSPSVQGIYNHHKVNPTDVSNWLKEHIQSYKQWKPNDGQMKALHNLNLTGNISYAGQGQVLIELYNDLKKLREE